jgi:mono/diheme cytochrome c family protein
MRIAATAGAAIGTLVLAAVASTLDAQPSKSRAQSLTIESMYGADLYDFYCASCHGIDGKGNGPTAPALKVPPSDLTTLSRRNGGVFPRQRLQDYVTGVRETPAHGSAEMPVWGPIFRALDPKDSTNKVRIANIVDHIELLQARR